MKPLAKEYDDVDGQIKKIVEGKEKLLVGDWFITGKWVNKKSYNVPSEIKEQYLELSQYWKKQIIKVQGGEHGS